MNSECVLPCPLFEGSEKRLAAELSFGAASPVEGLRALQRGQIDALLHQVCSFPRREVIGIDFDCQFLASVHS